MMPVQSMVKRTQEAKMNAAIAVIAMQLAKKNNDINAKKATIGKKLLLGARANILMRYGNMARQQYMQTLNNPK